MRWMDEEWRPQFHYTAAKNMINDPNGLVFYEGEWHLFHQYNQHEVVHWGHAVSTDLLHWTHLEPAIFPDRLGQIYSGTAVVDVGNSAGLGRGSGDVLVAFFTYADHDDGTQSQGLAYSEDRGRSWTMHPGNPILPNPGQRDFRDPKVFWHPESASWVMVVTAGAQLEIFRSRDLVAWDLASRWGEKEGSHDGVWECPDLFPMTVDGDDDQQWILSVSVDRGAPAGGSGMQYFIGDFDGFRFTNANSPDVTLWQNWGQDYYAAISWENVPASDGRRIMIAWADNWLYRFSVPTRPFNGQLTVPREVFLVRTPDGLRLGWRPVEEIAALRRWSLEGGPRVIPRGSPATLGVGCSVEVVIDVDCSATTAGTWLLEAHGEEGESAVIGVSPARGIVYVDRSEAGIAPTDEFTGRHEAPLAALGSDLTLRVLIDRSSVEVFVDDSVQFTELLLPRGRSWTVLLRPLDGRLVLARTAVHELARVWDDREAGFGAITGEWARVGDRIQGSSTERGLALLDGSVDSCRVEIVGTRAGNPTTVLGECRAGLVVGYDAESGRGIAFVLDRQLGAVEARALDTGDLLDSATFAVETNRAYDLAADTVGRCIDLRIDGDSMLRLEAELPGFGTCVLVENAEARFEPRAR